MTTASYMRATGLTIHAAPSLFSGAGSLVDITDLVASWSHTIAAMGGYKSANITLYVDQATLDDWLDTGIGKDITLYSPSGQVRFNGFVNNISATIGGLSITIGPLMQIANRARTVYSTVDTTFSPPAVGVRANSTTYNNTGSQTLYGVQSKVLSVGGATLASANQITQTYLAEMSIPQVSQTLNIGAGGAASLKLDCLGYDAFLQTYPYANTASGTTTISTRIPLVLAAQPAALYSTDYSGIATNTTVIPVYENNDRTAWTIITSLVAKGDATFNRYIFGIYANRKATYAAAPTAIEYYHQISSEYAEVTDSVGYKIDPWDVLPGKWLMVNDLMIGRTSSAAALSEDPRNIFIESISFTAPNGLSITGGRVSKLSQYLAQLGLAGVGVR